jgi:hypothetical protein
VDRRDVERGYRADGNVWTFNCGKIPVQVYTQDARLVKY